MIIILGLVGSLRKESFNKKLMISVRKYLPKDIKLEIFGLGEIPIFNQDLENNMPLAVKHLKEKIKIADGVLISTPEYNYSFSGVIKNAIDWSSRPVDDNPWNKKPVAIMGASISGFGTVRAQMHLRQVFVYLNGRVMNKPEFFLSLAQTKFDEKGELNDSESQKRLVDFLKGFKDFI